MDPPAIVEGAAEMSDRASLPVRVRGTNQVPLQVNDVLTHPMAGLESGQSREKWRYKFLRTIRTATIDRPDSGRILVENVVTGERKDFYAVLFGVSFKAV